MLGIEEKNAGGEKADMTTEAAKITNSTSVYCRWRTAGMQSAVEGLCDIGMAISGYAEIISHNMVKKRSGGQPSDSGASEKNNYDY